MIEATGWYRKDRQKSKRRQVSIDLTGFKYGARPRHGAYASMYLFAADTGERLHILIPAHEFERCAAQVCAAQIVMSAEERL